MNCAPIKQEGMPPKLRMRSIHKWNWIEVLTQAGRLEKITYAANNKDNCGHCDHYYQECTECPLNKNKPANGSCDRIVIEAIGALEILEQAWSSNYEMIDKLKPGTIKHIHKVQKLVREVP